VRVAELITTASDGRLVVETYTAGAILAAGKEFDGVIGGAVEAVHAPSGWVVSYVPAGLFFCNWVGGHTGTQLMMWLLYEGDELARELYSPIGVHFVTNLTVHPAEVWGHSSKALNSVEDIQGLKMRLGTTALNSIFSKMGATPVFLPGGEIYESMQRGVIDAFEYITPSLNWGMGFHEVADYMYLSTSRAPDDAQSLYVNQKAWDKLTPGLQDIVYMATKTAAQEFFTESVVRDDTALEKFIEYGTQVEQLPKDIEDLLYEKAEEYYAEESAKDPVYARVFEAALAWKKLMERAGIK